MGDGFTEDEKQKLVRQKSHMPKDSVLFERIVPVVLVLMGIVMVGLILFAAGVLLGLVSF